VALVSDLRQDVALFENNLIVVHEKWGYRKLSTASALFLDTSCIVGNPELELKNGYCGLWADVRELEPCVRVRQVNFKLLRIMPRQLQRIP
jgi:hypothetical protein